MLQAIGSPRFADILLDLVHADFGVVELNVWTLRGSSPQTVLSASRRAGAEDRASAWCERFCHHDPSFALLAAAPAGRIVATCTRISESAASAYRSLFQFGGGLDELVSFAFRDTDLVVLNLYCRRGASLGGEELARLNAMSLTLMSAVRAHAEARRRAGPIETTVPPLPMVEEMLRAVRPDLTERETQVCARTATGMTALAISLDLGISVSTVITYRRRAYARMGICSAYELLGSLISSSDSRILEDRFAARAA
jgi:DNA-binding CsgD family transcriptional regulator